MQKSSDLQQTGCITFTTFSNLQNAVYPPEVLFFKYIKHEYFLKLYTLFFYYIF
jgi:hypothetical protein